MKKIKFITKEKSGIKTEKNYNKLLRIFKKQFPGWISLKYINDNHKLNFIFESDLEKLKENGILDMEEHTDPRALELRYVINRKMYRLTPKGFDFLNNLKIHRKNTVLVISTIILILIGLFQISRLFL